MPPFPEVTSMNRRIACVSTFWLILGVCCGAPSIARGQSGDPAPVLEGRPDAEPADSRTDARAGAAHLGDVFESQSAGIAFRAPLDCKQIRRPGADEIVQYVNDAKKW